MTQNGRNVQGKENNYENSRIKQSTSETLEGQYATFRVPGLGMLLSSFFVLKKIFARARDWKGLFLEPLGMDRHTLSRSQSVAGEQAESS